VRARFSPAATRRLHLGPPGESRARHPRVGVEAPTTRNDARLTLSDESLLLSPKGNHDAKNYLF
jgi:hypothetical protein